MEGGGGGGEHLVQGEATLHNTRDRDRLARLHCLHRTT